MKNITDVTAGLNKGCNTGGNAAPVASTTARNYAHPFSPADNNWMGCAAPANIKASA